MSYHLHPEGSYKKKKVKTISIVKIGSGKSTWYPRTSGLKKNSKHLLYQYEEGKHPFDNSKIHNQNRPHSWKIIETA